MRGNRRRRDWRRIWSCLKLMQPPYMRSSCPGKITYFYSLLFLVTLFFELSPIIEIQYPIIESAFTVYDYPTLFFLSLPISVEDHPLSCLSLFTTNSDLTFFIENSPMTPRIYFSLITSTNLPYFSSLKLNNFSTTLIINFLDFLYPITNSSSLNPFFITVCLQLKNPIIILLIYATIYNSKVDICLNKMFYLFVSY